MIYSLNIAWLYPDLMSTYGDRGNIIVLKKRCEWRGIDARIKNITLETRALELNNCNLVFMGGAQDRQQKLAAVDFLRRKAPVLKKMIENFTPSLFVCAAYQQIGHYYRPYQGRDIKGASIFNLTTIHPGDQAKRLIGNIVAELIYPQELKGTKIVGFENHGGRTVLGGDLNPLAKVIKGFGNDGRSGFEGAFYKNSIGSYFHGPILTKNPQIADWLISRALEIKYGKRIKLFPLDDSLAMLAKQKIIDRLNI